MPEHEPEQELGPKIADAFQRQADEATGLRARGMAAEARRRVRKRRQTMSVAAAAVVVAVAIGGVWNSVGGPTPEFASSAEGQGENHEPGRSGAVAPTTPSATACPSEHPIIEADGPHAIPAGTGLDLDTRVTGLLACRYRLAPGDTKLLGQEHFNAGVAQQVVDAIKVLPERNPDLPVFKCTPETARPDEAIVLQFGTADGVREVWVHYDGCDSAGFFTGTRTYGLYAEPLKLFMKGDVRPSGGTYLDALDVW